MIWFSRRCFTCICHNKSPNGRIVIRQSAGILAGGDGLTGRGDSTRGWHFRGLHGNYDVAGNLPPLFEPSPQHRNPTTVAMQQPCSPGRLTGVAAGATNRF